MARGSPIRRWVATFLAILVGVFVPLAAITAMAIARHAEILERLGPTLIEPWRTSSYAIQAIHAAFIASDAEGVERWLANLPEPKNPHLRPGWAMARLGIAALRDASDRAEWLQTAILAVDEAAKLSNMNWEWERGWIAKIQNGWPQMATD